ncbi:YlxQ family RNA-binding protein [Staphylococcus simulans]|uniref:YlxQ family RNA-binding protein n=1 Tax=Staphylococcus simulans TaxID=1286 RepID=UPI000D1FC13F|nr:YlxQ family RNA-binding protein [Staphylococcus simulans]PTJ90537.1 hypothetical protein BU032_09165 [Staphylococcus simulans]
MNKSNILNFLGLAMRAGKVKSGESVILTEIKKRKTSLVILSEDASSRTTKEISQKCESYHIPLRIFGTREELGQALGKSSRVNIAIMDNGFAKKLLSMIDE